MPRSRFTISVLTMLTLLSASAVLAKPVKCDPGRFVPRGTSLVVGAVSGVTTGEAIVVTAAPGARLSISPTCGSARAHVKATKKGTKITATWKKGVCSGINGKVKLKGRIVANCAVLQGSIKKPKLKKTSFLADRATGCGDGLLDRDAGEECESDANCPTGKTCRGCSCQLPSGEPGTTTTTLETTTTTGPESTSTTTTTMPGVSGLLGIEAPAALEFGPVAVGSSASRTFTVRNLDSSPLGGVTVHLSVDSAAFTVDPPELALGSGDQADVTVEFHPQVAGHQSGAVKAMTDVDDLPVLVHGFGGSAPGSGPTLASEPLFFTPAAGPVGQLLGILPSGLRFTVDNRVRTCLLPDDEVSGDACTQDSDCNGGRVCVPFSYCEGGERAGLSCTHHTDCPGGFCPAESPLNPTDICSDGTGALYVLAEDTATDPDTQEARGSVARLQIDPTTGDRLSAQILYRTQPDTTQIACDGLPTDTGKLYVPEHHDVDDPTPPCARDEREALVSIAKATGAAEVVHLGDVTFDDIDTVAGSPICEDFEPVQDIHANRAGSSVFVTLSPYGLIRLVPQPTFDIVVNAFDQFDVHPDGSLVLVVATNLGPTGVIDVYRVSPEAGPLPISALTPCASISVPNAGGRLFVSKFAVGRAAAGTNDGTILATFRSLFGASTPPISDNLLPRGTVAVAAPAGTTGCTVQGLINLELLSDNLMTF